MRRKGWAVAAVGILVILGAIGIAWLNPQLTHYLESDRFRAELEKETAKVSRKEGVKWGDRAGSCALFAGLVTET
jgi:hypothetical protein